MALLSGGGHAQYCVVEKDHIIDIPDNLSFVEVKFFFYICMYNYGDGIKLGGSHYRSLGNSLPIVNAGKHSRK
mgnify:CR=1 FL=1